MRALRVFWAALLLSATMAKGAVLFTSGFEQPDVGPNYVPYLAPDNVDGWTIESGSVEIVGTYWQAAQGKQSMDLSGIWDWAGTISRDVETIPGRQYRLKFAFAGNPLDGDATKEMKVFWNENEVSDLTVNTKDRSFAQMGWEYHDYLLTATSTTSRIRFQSLTLNALGPTLDDVSLAEVTGDTVLDIRTYAGIWLQGTAGSSQEIQYATDSNDPKTWRTLMTVTVPSDGKMFILDPQPVGNAQRMYRALEVR